MIDVILVNMFNKKAFLKDIGWKVGEAALVVILVLLVTRTFKQKIEEIVVDLDKKKVDAYARQTKSQTTRELANAYGAVESSIAVISNAMPMADNVVDFQAALESIARKYSLQQVVAFGSPSGDQKTIDCDITLTGNINSLVKYLEDYEKLPYLASINSIGFQTKDSMGWEGDSVISMKGTIFTKPVTY